ncbi:nucleotide sugar dehydrogenase (plasmid) [Nocardia sp. NBC_01377]|uniref:nucleotide sugar dehydrogenase n=1 Tax=Nocardia sp. NBC_01377 TaxID=2903595 RepID=UPI002F90B176
MAISEQSGPDRRRPAVPRKVAVIGLGHVGSVVSMLAVAAGHNVIGYDIDPDRIARMTGGHDDLGDVPRPLIAEALASGRFVATVDPALLAGFEVAVISVPTPLIGGRPDLRCLEDAAATVAKHARPGCTVIVESTTWPGTTDEVVAPLLESTGLSVGSDVRLGYCPERINPGDGFAALPAVPKIVSGVDAASLAAVTLFWEGLVEVVVPAPDMRTAELAKLIENTFRLVNVSLVNEIARHTAGLGTDISAAVELAATKPYGFMAFRPGIGAGGHCIPVAPRYLSWRIGDIGGVSPLIDAALRVNDTVPEWVAERIVAGLARRGIAAADAVVLVAGITYKPNVAHVAGSRALDVIAALGDHGVRVLTYDPVAEGVADVFAVVTTELVSTVSAVAVLIAHDRLDLATLSTARYVFDACAVVAPGPDVEFL